MIIKRINEITPLWFAVVIYQLITITLIVTFKGEYVISTAFFVPRLIILLLFLFSPLIKRKYTILIDVLIIYALMGAFYGETAVLNTFLFNKIDDFLIDADQFIFGFQPSIIFSDKYGSILFSEIMYLGYFSYYIMPLGAFIYFWLKKRACFVEFTTIVLSSYFIYFLIFVLLPAEGPQFYFSAPENQIEAKGFFGNIVKTIQKYGEAPTAAFPSSHVGICLIILSLLFKYTRRLFYIYLPFSVLLFFSTVYIKAHYFIDVIAGILSAPIVFYGGKFLYLRIKKDNRYYDCKKKNGY